jgi:hypothetical protein
LRPGERVRRARLAVSGGVPETDAEVVEPAEDLGVAAQQADHQQAEEGDGDPLEHDELGQRGRL